MKATDLADRSDGEYEKARSYAKSSFPLSPSMVASDHGGIGVVENAPQRGPLGI